MPDSEFEGLKQLSVKNACCRIENSLFLPKNWDVSSVGLERLLDRQEVTGSIPVRPTLKKKELL